MGQLKHLKVESSAGDRKLTLDNQSTPANGAFQIFDMDSPQGPAGVGVRKKGVEKAVYAHIQALRSLGKTKVVVSDIANALALRQDVVLQALEALRAKGVKFL